MLISANNPWKLNISRGAMNLFNLNLPHNSYLPLNFKIDYKDNKPRQFLMHSLIREEFYLSLGYSTYDDEELGSNLVLEKFDKVV